MRKCLALGLAALVAALAASCDRPSGIGGATPAGATQPATTARTHDLEVVRQCGEVCGKLAAYAEVTFERGSDGWRVKDVHLFYRENTEPARVAADLRTLAQLTTLESIAIEGSYGSSTCKLTEAGLRALLPLKHLRRLSLHRLSAGVDLKALGELPELEELDLSGCIREDSRAADLVHLKDLPRLRKLNLEARDITDKSLEHLAPLTGLEVLNLDSNSDVTDAGLANLKGLKNLRELSLSLVSMTDAGLAELKELKNLEVLDLYPYVARFGGKGLANLSGLTNLRELSIVELEVTPNDLLVLKGLPHLERLTVGGRVNEVEGKLDLSFLSSLKELHIHLDVGKAEIVFPEGLRVVDFSVEQIRWASYRPALARLPNVTIKTFVQREDEGLPLLRELPNPIDLDSITLIGDNGTEAFVAAAPKSLRFLHISICFARPFTDASLKSLAKLERLEYLEAKYYGRFSGAGIAELGQLKNLRRLELDGLTADAFARVAELKEIRSLALGAVRPQNRSEKPPLPLIDSALAGWKALRQLDDLSIGKVTLTDEGLKHLAGLEKLRALNLADCPGYTDAGLAWLMQASRELTTVNRTYQPAAPPATRPSGPM